MSAPDSKDKKKNQDILENPVDFIMQNKTDTIIYVLLLIGILTFVFNGIYGGLIVGVIAGFYFSETLVSYVMDINDYVESEGLFKSFVLGGTLLCLLIAAPTLLIGIAASAGITHTVMRSHAEKAGSEDEKAE